MHEISFLSFPMSMSKSEIAEKCGDYTEGHGDYHDRRGSEISFSNAKSIFNTYDDAYDWILKNDNGFYEQIAVPYYEVDGIKESKKVKDIQERLNKAKETYVSERRKLFCVDMKSQLYTCKKCGSKLSVKYLKHNECPVCQNDLRSPTQQEKLNRYNDKVESLTKQLKTIEKEEAIKNRKKAKMMWLVKVEYHV